MPPRILVAGIWHETNTFSTVLTDLDAFKAYQYHADGDVLVRHRGSNTEIGGFIAGAEAYGLDLCPALFAAAVPSGLVTRAAYDHIVVEILRRAKELMPLDGALIALHGAMAVDGLPYAEAVLLTRLREILGAGCPIAATFDLHANLSQELVDAADILIGYDTFPHVDFADRGREAAAALAALLRDGERPACAFRKLPLITVPQVQVTHEPPMVEVIAALDEVKQDPGVVCCSVAQGFAYADTTALGVSVVAYGAAAASAVDKIAGMIWSRRFDFLPELVPVDDAVRLAIGEGSGTVVLAEPADNVGGGAPGDGAIILEALLQQGAPSAVMVIWDPSAVAQATAVGLGGTFDGPVGGRSMALHGPPAHVRGRIEFVGDVTYTRTGSYMAGQRVPMGGVVVVDAAGVRIVITSKRVMPFDSDHLRAVGVVPEMQRIIVAKSGSAWRAAFDDFARKAIYVDTPGVCTSNVEQLPYVHAPPGMFPLDRNATWAAADHA